jgi:tripartite-type tricarboxylate transporter receptor subunit TctC
MIDLAKTDEQRAMVRFLEVAPRVGMGFWVSPEVPKARAVALRKAFQAMLRDPAFLADAAKRKAPVSPVSGETLDRIVAEVYKTPPATIAKLKKVFGFK